MNPITTPSLPRIALVTTCKGRTSHLSNTLPRNLADNADYPNCVFVILDYSDPGELREYLTNHHDSDMAGGRIVVYRYDAPGPFKMAFAKNLVHRCGIMEGADILINLDADNYTGPGFVQYVADQFANQSDIFMWANIIPGQGKAFRGCGGRIIITPNIFINSGGYDEIYENWGPDDKQFNGRLVRMGYTSVEIDKRYLRAVPHKDGVRFKEYPHARVDSTEDELTVDTSCTVVNRGHIGCGVVHHNYSPDPIYLDPIPTRIFGIGFHKTATNSLHKALTILGYDSAHWKSARWAKAIWKEMRQFGRSATLERHYALSDFPIALLYRQLDRAYPGSRFILTTRDEQSWLNSVRNHWTVEGNEFRASWDEDCFTNELHREIYGRTDFDADTFLARYRRHNDEIRQYFRSRSNTLLEMNMSDGSGWEQLCGFLDQPVPKLSYPFEYQTATK